MTRALSGQILHSDGTSLRSGFVFNPLILSEHLSRPRAYLTSTYEA
jgi:hypothetical protein